MNEAQNQRLKIARERLGLTRSQMSELLGINFSTYAMIERGERSLTPKHVNNIVEKTDICREWLETGRGEILRSDKNQALYDIIMSLDEADREMLISMAKRLAESNKKDV